MTRTDDALSEAAVAYLRQHGTECAYEAGATVINRGDPGRAFFVVLEGELAVFLGSGDERRLPLARLRPGASFGEMALLRDEPVSADVVALTRARLLEYPKDRFHFALAEFEPLRRELLARLAENLENTSAVAFRSHLRAETLDSLVRHGSCPGPVIARSSRMRAVEAEVARLTATDGPLLVSGDPGTGKAFLASVIHAGSDRADGPLIVVDSHQLAAADVAEVLLGSAATAGFKSTATRFGVLHLADAGTMVLRHLEVLPDEAQSLLAGYLRQRAATGSGMFPDVRLIATLRGDTHRLVASGRLEASLVEQLECVQMPRLADRRKDILPLARQFISELGGQHQLTPDAERALVSHRYHQLNVAELRDAVQLAVLVSDGPEIGAEHVFAGAQDDGSTHWLDLSRLPAIQWLTTPKTLRGVRAAVLLSFVATIVVCLVAASQSVAARAANSFIWSAWEPVVFALFLLAGPVWCTVCPLSSAGQLAQRLACLERPPPAWVKRFGVWMGVAGFFAIVWSERVYHMTTAPMATAVMLSSLIAASVLFSVVYRREVWCRYVCPLGMLATGLSPSAPLAVRADADVCTTVCTTHECYRGTKGGSGCPVFHHPMFATEGHLCKLCLGCLSACPHRSARLSLRLPLQSLWRMGQTGAAMAPFAVAVFLLAPVILASQGSSFVARPAGLTVAGMVAVALGATLALRLPRLLAGDSEVDPAATGRVAFALLILGWGPLMAYQAANIPALAALQVSAAPESYLVHLLPGPTPILAGVQLGLILLAASLAALTLWRIRVRATEQEMPISPVGWRVLVGMCAAYVIAAVALVL